MMTDGPGMPPSEPPSEYERGVEALITAHADGDLLCIKWRRRLIVRIERAENGEVGVGYAVFDGEKWRAGCEDPPSVAAAEEMRRALAPAPPCPPEVAAAVRVADAAVARLNAWEAYQQAQLTATSDAEIEELDRLYGVAAATNRASNDAETAYRALKACNRSLP